MTEELEKLIGDLAVRGAYTPGLKGWRAESMCRQIAQLLNRDVPEHPLPEEILS